MAQCVASARGRRISHTLIVIVLYLLLIVEVGCYDLVAEGFLTTTGLPGGANDPRGLPNLPYSVDTNRYADGVVSNAGYETTSTHFPNYRGAIANVTDRYLHYKNYMESAASQGIAGYGAGAARQEDAKVKITSLPNYENLKPPSKTFPVYAAIKWNPSDFAIQEGEWYNITVFGSDSGYSSQFWNDGAIRVNAEGYSSYYDAVSNCYVGVGRCHGYLKRKRRLVTANWMSLACAIGEFSRAVGEPEPGKEADMHWLPGDEATLQATIFNVGRSVVFRAINSGQLICFANDAHSNYWNNYGSLMVTASRIRYTDINDPVLLATVIDPKVGFWPPNAENVYQDLYLPACDSAIAIYANKGKDNSVMKCNPNGGGSGWKLENVISTSANYGSGIPESLLN